MLFRKVMEWLNSGVYELQYIMPSSHYISLTFQWWMTLKYLNNDFSEYLNDRQILRCRGHVDNKPNREIRPSNIKTGTYVHTIWLDTYVTTVFTVRNCDGGNFQLLVFSSMVYYIKLLSFSLSAAVIQKTSLPLLTYCISYLGRKYRSNTYHY